MLYETKVLESLCHLLSTEILMVRKYPPLQVLEFSRSNACVGYTKNLDPWKKFLSTLHLLLYLLHWFWLLQWWLRDICEHPSLHSSIAKTVRRCILSAWRQISGEQNLVYITKGVENKAGTEETNCLHALLGSPSTSGLIAQRARVLECSALHIKVTGFELSLSTERRSNTKCVKESMAQSLEIRSLGI